MTSEKYSLSELMACVLSREINDNEVNGSPGVRSAVVIAALRLARYHHAPNMVAYTAFSFNPAAPISKFTTDYSFNRVCEQILPCGSDIFDREHRGRMNFFMAGGMQVDKYGNLNLVCLGDWHHPKFRGPGSAGLGTNQWTRHHCLWMNEHSKRTFVEKVDFVSYAGWLDGPGAREKAGLHAYGPPMVVSTLCVCDFEPETKKMRLKSVHPGVTVQQVVDNTGFELVMPKKVPETEPPTKDELELLREVVDPHGVLRDFMPVG